MRGPQVKKRKLHKVRIYDITPTILYLLRLPIPPDVDGRVLFEAFEDKLACNTVDKNQRDKEFPSLQNERKYVGECAEEEKEIKKRLKRLGYL